MERQIQGHRPSIPYEANQENNQDGSNDNHSWNCGAEGDTQDAQILHLRKKMVKNALCCLLFSSGTPMIYAGDEFMNTQRGNNNAYCQDNEITWINWDDLKQHADIVDFCKEAILFRKHTPLLRLRRFLNGDNKNNNGAPDIAWFGKDLQVPAWDDASLKTLSYQLTGKETLFFILNMDHQEAQVCLPQLNGSKWHLLVDTSQESGHDFYSYDQRQLLPDQQRHRCEARTINILWAG